MEMVTIKNLRSFRTFVWCYKPLWPGLWRTFRKN